MISSRSDGSPSSKIETHVSGKGVQELAKEDMVLDAVIRNFETIRQSPAMGTGS